MELQLFFALLRSVICGEALPEEYKKPISEEQIKTLLDLAKAHSLLPLLSEALLRHKLLQTNETEELCQALLFQSISIYQQQTEALRQLCRLLNEAEIPHLPLKGSVLKKYYPEPWLRTSCDIDVLVPLEQYPAAKELLQQNDYRFLREGSHDSVFLSPEEVSIELHYTLLEQKRLERTDALLERIWQYAFAQNDTFTYELQDEMFYFYHIVHMAKHFEGGGCGVRSFIDLWILNHSFPFDKEKREALLQEARLEKFAKAVEKLSEVWLSGAAMDISSEMVQEFILMGGVYGTMENRVTLQQSKQGNKVTYLLRRLFIPYDELKFRYPILQKHKWLLPVMEVRRLGRLFLSDKRKQSAEEFKATQNLQEEEQQTAKKLWEYLGL
ncbi:MAG: nucleotidyltransferase family protein [Clostridia bacterium]|nr:nucleotidyltransferase family protein [Clostridia bacterium]